MSSFSCPHFDFATDRCLRLETACVPGRPGCVLRGRAEFIWPVEERIREREAQDAAAAGKAAPPRAVTAPP